MSVIQTVQQGPVHKREQQEGTRPTASLTGESVVCVSHCDCLFLSMLFVDLEEERGVTCKCSNIDCLERGAKRHTGRERGCMFDGTSFTTPMMY